MRPGVWKNQNEARLKSLQVQELDIVCRALIFLKNARDVPSLARDFQLGWDRPRQGWIKVNVDTALFWLNPSLMLRKRKKGYIPIGYNIRHHLFPFPCWSLLFYYAERDHFSIYINGSSFNCCQCMPTQLMLTIITCWFLPLTTLTAYVCCIALNRKEMPSLSYHDKYLNPESSMLLCVYNIILKQYSVICSVQQDILYMLYYIYIQRENILTNDN